MDETGGHYTKETTLEKGKYHMISIIRSFKKKNDGTQTRKMIAQDWRVGQIGRDFLKVTYFHV